MKEGFFQERRLLFSCWLISLIIGAVIALTTEKGDAILFLNQYYTQFTVPFFTFFTKMGEMAGFIVPLLYFMLFKPVKYQLGFVMVGLATLILVYFFKHIVYPDTIRPIVYFELNNIELLNRSNVTLNRKFTFPSGHTTAGFAYFFYAALSAKHRIFTMLFFVTAVLIGVSRIFLAQHFVIDVLAGSTLGVAIATTVFFVVIYKGRFNSRFLNQQMFDV